MKKYFFQILTSFGIIVLLLNSCANVGTLTGGDKDSLAPVMLGSNPQDKGKNFKGDKIIIQFDEYFQFAGIEEEFYVSPLLKTKPKISVKKKNIIINLEETLDDSTTYTFNFGSAIQDYHENNPLPNFKFVCSTGEIVDTFRIAGKVIDAYKLTNVEKCKVVLYKSWRDSTPMLDTPQYITKTDTSGNFELDFIKPGKYKIFAVNDLDDNYLYNLSTENIAFSDSLIIPEIEQTVRYDTVRGGTVLKEKFTDKILDTLDKDSVIVTRKNIYKPDSLILISFIEKPARQYLKKSERKERAKFNFIYSNPQDSFQIICTDELFNSDEMIIESNKNKDSVIIWLKNPALFSIDTLTFLSSIYNADSLDILKKETDTLQMIFKQEVKQASRKKEKEIIDTIPKKMFLNLEFEKKEQNIHLPYIFNTQNPVSEYDTSKIKLYEIIDTAFADPKTQKIISANRIEYDKILIAFKRPVIKDVKLRLLNYWTENNWYSGVYNKNRDSILFTISDPKIVELDTVKLFVYYDNDFFFNTVQNLEDSLIFPLIKQEFVTAKRTSRDKINIYFKKPISDDFKLRNIKNPKENSFEISKKTGASSAEISIKDIEYRKTDTLSIEMIMYDFTDSTGNKILFQDTAKILYQPIKQKHTCERKKQDEIYISFTKQVNGEVFLHPLNFKTNMILEKTISKTNDTVFVKIKDNNAKKLDTLTFSLKYFSLNGEETIEQISDTVSFVYKKPKKESSDQEKSPVKVEMPVKMSLKTDSASTRKFICDYNWKEGISYKIIIDSLAFRDIFSLYNKKMSSEFKVRKINTYSKINLRINDIAKITDPFFYKGNKSTDSSSFSRINSGKIIIFLKNDKGGIIRQITTNQNIDTTLEYIEPGEYSLHIIYDANENDKQDTGNFLKKIQPEKLIIYPEKIVTEADKTKEIIWLVKFKDLNIREKAKK